LIKPAGNLICVRWHNEFSFERRSSIGALEMSSEQCVTLVFMHANRRRPGAFESFAGQFSSSQV
jgi:hypothetical protein